MVYRTIPGGSLNLIDTGVGVTLRKPGAEDREALGGQFADGVLDLLDGASMPHSG